MPRLFASIYMVFLGVGFFTTGILLLFILRRPNKNKQLFLLFYIFYAFLCLADSMEILFYHHFDYHGLPSISVLLLSSIPPYIMIGTLVKLFHRILNIPSMKTQNKGVLFFLLFLLLIDLAEDIWPQISNTFSWINGIEGWGIILILIYFLILLKKYPAEDSHLKKITQKLPFIISYTIVIILLQLIPIMNTQNIPLNGIHFFINTIIILIYAFKYYGQLLQPYHKPEETFSREKKLTQKERELLDLLLQGQSYNEIANNMMISINTVRTHIKNLYTKTGVNNRYSLLALFHHY